MYNVCIVCINYKVGECAPNYNLNPGCMIKINLAYTFLNYLIISWIAQATEYKCCIKEGSEMATRLKSLATC